MKIAEKVETDGKTLAIKQTHSAQPVLDRARRLRESDQRGENRLVASVPMEMVQVWLDEAGVTWDNTEARQEILQRKLLLGEFNKFRVWQGTF